MMTGLGKKKIAVVYDWIDKWGGVERVLLTLHEMFPKAEFHTSYFDVKNASWAKHITLKTSFIQSLPSALKKSRIWSFFLYPYAFESFDFSRFDMVISITSSFAKCIVTKPNVFHICYLLTPTRYLWSHQDDYFKNPIVKAILSPFLDEMRRWDFISAQRPDIVVSISNAVAERCRAYYRRGSQVIYPPFDMEYWKKIKSQITSNKFQTSNLKKSYLVVSRLEPYKKVDLVVRSFNRLKDTLVIVGTGTEEAQLKKIAGSNIFFLKNITDSELGLLYQNAEALIMPQEEDFGYVSLEAQYFNCPVIAYKRGGSLETIQDSKTGIFFEDQTEKGLMEALERYHTISYNLRTRVKTNGEKNTVKFSRAIFKEKFLKALNNEQYESDYFCRRSRHKTVASLA